MLSRLLRKQQVSRWFNITLVKSINGKRFKIPVFAKMGTGNYFMNEPWMVDVLERILPARQGAFLDIGANIGQTLIKLRSISATIQYVGIEPNPSCVFYLRELIRQNGFTGCTVVPAGIFKQDDLLELTLLQEDDSDSNATLLAKEGSGATPFQRQFVPVLPFDVVRQRLGLASIGVVKMDVEGAELEVLQSLAQTLDELRPLLLVEILPVYQQENTVRRERQEQTEALLASHGYSLARICKTPAGRLAGLEPISAIGIHADLSLCDYLACPSELSSSLLSRFEMV